MIVPISLDVTTTGSAGSASGTTDPAVAGTYGHLVGAWIDYRGQPATADLVVKETINGTARTLVTLTNQNTDRAWYPMTLGQDGTGANLTAIYIEGIPLFGGLLTAEIAQGDAAAPAARVTLLVRK